MKKKLQIFVSSTFNDLRLERQAAVEAILKAGHIPAGMELFTAGDKSQMLTIERWIDESDIFMLILGSRYGSLEPTTGVSYTELEYNYASDKEKPLFAVVITDSGAEQKAKAFGRSHIETENPQQLKQFREKVLSRTCSFFEDLKDIKLSVHESLSDYAQNPELQGWISASEVPNIKSLQDEIAQLRLENEELKLQSARSADARLADRGKPDNQKLFSLLKSIEIIVPKSIEGTQDLKSDLLSLTYNYKDILALGIHNSFNASPIESFIYHNIIPRLQVHGLADSEKVAGARYRRGFLNKRGLDFVAFLETQLFNRSLTIHEPGESTDTTPKKPSSKQTSADHTEKPKNKRTSGIAKVK